MAKNLSKKNIGTVLDKSGAAMGIEDISATSLECRALVLWGTNLQSTVGARLTRTQSGFYEKLPIKIQGIIVGLLLSDGWMTFANSRISISLYNFLLEHYLALLNYILYSTLIM